MRVGAYAWIERHGGAVLLTHWGGRTTWDGRQVMPSWVLPGGGLLPGEGPERAAVREVAEETGHRIELLGLIGEFHSHVAAVDRTRPTPRPLEHIRLVYRARIVGGELTGETGGSTDKVAWVPAAALERLPVGPPIAAVLRALGRSRTGPVADDEPVDEDAVARVLGALRGAPRRCEGVAVIAVDGPSGAGKTVLADAVAQHLACPVVHMDDLYAGWDGLADAVPRLRSQLLEPLCAGVAAVHRRWDWERGDWADAVVLPPTPVLVVEGCGSSARPAGDLATVRVWVDAPVEVRKRRALERDGETYQPHWEQWARQEAALFGADRTRARADVVIWTE